MEGVDLLLLALHGRHERLDLGRESRQAFAGVLGGASRLRLAFFGGVQMLTACVSARAWLAYQLPIEPAELKW